MTRFAKIAVWPLLAVGLGSLAFVACGGEEANDSPRVEADMRAATVIAMPDEFTSIAARCFGTDMVYAARNTNGRAVAVSPNHPWCADGVLTTEEQDR